MSSAESIESLMEAGHWKQARLLVNTRLRTNPNDAFALYLSSKVAASFDNFEAALSAAERAVALEGHNPDYLGQLAEIHVRLADKVSLVKRVRYVQQFKREVEAALAINPKHVDTLLVDIMFLSKAPLVAGGDRKQANTLADQLARFEPSWGYLIQARLAEQEKDDARIERALRRSVESRPSFYPARYYLGKFYCCAASSPRLDAAEKQGRDMIRLDPRQSGGYEILARVYAQQQKWDDLEAILADSEARVPEDLTPYYQAAGILLERRTDPARAIRYLRKYLSQDPEGRQPSLAQAQSLLASTSRSASLQ